MKYCVKCGTQMEDTVKFCPNCGTPAQNVPDSTPAPTNVEPTNEPPTQPPVIKNGQSGLGIAAFILSLTIILAPLAFIFSFIDLVNNKKDKRHGLATAGLVISSIIILLYIVGARNSSSKESTTESTATSSVVATEDTSDSGVADVDNSENAESAEIGEPNETVVTDKNGTKIITLQLGESADVGDLRVTVESYDFSKYLGGLKGLAKAESGLTYCTVHIKAKNMGTKTLELQHTILSIPYPNYGEKLVFDHDYEYLGTFSSDYSDFFDAHESIPALGEIECCFSYKVSKDLENEEDKQIVFQFSTSDSVPDVIYQWVLRDELIEDGSGS